MIVRRLHRWMGLSISLFVVVIGVTGSLLLWKKEYLWLTVPTAQQTLIRDDSIIAKALTRIRESYAPDDVSFVQLYSEDLPIHKVFLSDKRYAWHDQSGNQIEVWSGNQRFEDWLLDLHHRFLLGNTIGLNIAGFTGLLLIPLSVLGLVVWWPRRRFLKLGVVPRSKARGAWMLSHYNLGGIIALPLFMTALTGVILVYPSESRVVLLGAEHPSPVLTFETQTQAYETSSDAPPIEQNIWRSLLDVSHQRFPGSHVRWVTLDTSESADRVIGLQHRDGFNRTGKTSLRFKPDGVIEIKNELVQPLSHRLVSFTYPLHIGRLGIWYRLLLTCIGIGIVMLVLMGLRSWTKRAPVDN